MAEGVYAGDLIKDFKGFLMKKERTHKGFRAFCRQDVCRREAFFI